MPQPFVVFLRLLLPVFIHVVVVVLICAGGDVVHPLLIVEIPAHSALDALLELQTRFPTELSLQFAAVDCVAHIMPFAVGHVCNQVERRAFGVAEQPVDGLDQHPHDVDVFPLVETADIVLPDFFSANDGLKSCRDQYRPLSFIPLVSGMKNSAYNYNKPFAADYIFELGGDGIEKRLSYIYRVQFSLCDIKSAKEKFQKHIDDNSDFFRKQLALYKEYSSDVTGIEIIFKSDISNQTLASKIFS